MTGPWTHSTHFMFLHSLHCLWDTLGFVIVLWLSQQLAMVYWRLFRKYREDRASAQRAWFERPIPNLTTSFHLDFTKTLLQVTIISYPDCVFSIWSAHILPGLLLCPCWSLYLKCCYFSFMPSYIIYTSSQLCLLQESFLNLFVTLNALLNAPLAPCASSSQHFSQ